jgi:MYXO-CTERM domain-containing protein
MFMFSRFRHVFGVLFFLLVASCSGGGCSSGCGGCGGTTPLPGGFPKDKTIDNAASVRVSRPGLDFVEKNLPAVVTKVANAPGGVLGFDIPNIDPAKAQIADLSIFGKLYVDTNVCPGGPDPAATPPRCHAAVGIGKATFLIDAVKPNAVQLKATIPVQLDDTPIEADVSYDPPIVGPVNLGGLTIHVGYGDGGCSNGKPQVTAHALPVGITIPLVEETTAPRTGYMKIDVGGATVDLSGISENDVHVCSSCGFASSICSAITDSGFVKGLVIGPLKSNLESQVKSLLADQLCMAPSPALNPPCPTDTAPDAANKHCVFNSDKNKCVGMLLGTDAHVDLGGFLKSISPGTSGGIDFGLAAGGSMKPFPNANANAQGRTPNGITLGMLGGVLPQPQSKCVPQADLKVPSGIPIPDELAPTVNDSATTPHVGIALAGRFLDYTFGSVYNSGLLCLGVSSEQIDQLRSGLLSILIPSLKTLTFEQGDAPAAIATRPQAPPIVKIGGGTNAGSDALLQITLPKFALDFYLWHLDRYVRVFTFQADLLIPVNLQTGKDPKTNPNGGIIPAIGDIKVTNGVVTNADLLMDDPVLVSGALSGLLGGLGKQLVGGGFSPIDLSGALKSFGLGLEIGKIGKLTKGTDDYVGIFATLSKAAGTATVEADTQAKLVSKHVPLDHMQLATMDRAFLPELVVDLGSPLDDGRHAIEYSWWIDNGTRSEWAAAKHVVIKDDQLLLQGRHTLRVSARVAGETETEDATPAELPFTIDALAPSVKVEKDGSQATIKAWDVVSSPAALVGRYKLDGAEFGEWRSVADLARVDVGASETIDVEVKDEEGNVRSVHQELIRGKADSSLAAAGSGCGCSTPGSTSSGNTNGLYAAALGLVGLGLIALRRRAALRSGSFSRSRGGIRSVHAALALGTITIVAATSQGCACGSEADSTPGCGADCNQECKEELPKGLPGSYTSVAKAADGSIWVAGYNDALLSEGDSQLWGDLVVGKYDSGKQGVDWKTVDGLPTRAEGTCADRSTSSWRNGESDSGDDVGLWTSMQVSADGRPMVSYYDATNKKLKLAVLISAEERTWKVITLKEQPGADVGRYSKMVIVSGKPVIAFLQIETGNAGKTRSKVVVARANIEVPQEASDFRFEDAAVEEENPCAASTCTSGQTCVKTTGVCTPTVGGCTPADCGMGKACVTEAAKATCVAVKSNTQTYPDVFGDYISLAQGGGKLGMVVYDRPHGNLIALAEQGEGKWARTIIDGETGSRKDKTAIDTGDVGVAASLAIDNSGTWHITYVSGLDETLRYLTVTGGKPGKSEIIDDGSTVDGKAFPDGKHVIGDDSAVRAEGDVITVYYQDATVGTLRRAAGTKSGATHKWDLRTLQQPNRFGGYFPQIVPGEDKVANFWEQTDHAVKTRIGDVTILSP